MSFDVRLTDWARDASKLAAVRREVFIVEQRIDESLEWDAADATCVHALAEDRQGTAIGCGRLLPDGYIGRLAVRAKWRNRGVGSALLASLIECSRDRGDTLVKLNAQVSAIPFYERHGFAEAGAPFEEAGIAHQAMERTIDRR
ncbi:MAG TPA: GNAT family N-acetyltransferase [Casimicrobiaceae bacterium]|nr:GNAT family N-acetyltransferase [Casimicrobiaceae bacterium]